MSCQKTRVATCASRWKRTCTFVAEHARDGLNAEWASEDSHVSRLGERGQSGTSFDCFKKKLRDIEHFGRFGRGSGCLLGGQPIGQHDPAERASGSNCIVTVASAGSERAQRLLRAVLIDAGAELL